MLAADGGSLVLACPRGKVAQVPSLTGVSDVIPVAVSWKTPTMPVIVVVWTIGGPEGQREYHAVVAERVLARPMSSSASPLRSMA